MKAVAVIINAASFSDACSNIYKTICGYYAYRPTNSGVGAVYTVRTSDPRLLNTRWYA